MKAVFTKTLVVMAGGVLVVPFVAAAVLVGARAVAGAGGTRQFLLLLSLASVWTLFGGVKGSARAEAGEREGHEPLAAPRRGTTRHHAFLHTRGL
jgi:hypothetical protein